MENHNTNRLKNNISDVEETQINFIGEIDVEGVGFQKQKTIGFLDDGGSSFFQKQKSIIHKYNLKVSDGGLGF